MPTVQNVREENGSIMVFLAVFAFALAMVCLGYAVDVPFAMWTKSKAQRTIQEAQTEGVSLLPFVNDAVTLTQARIASEMVTGPAFIRDPYSGTASAPLSLWMPTVGNGIYKPLNTGTAYDSVFAQAFDPPLNGTRVDDVGNGFFSMGRYRSFSWLTLFGEHQVEIASAVIAAHKITYLLFGAAYPLGRNHARTFTTDPGLSFGATGAARALQFPPEIATRFLADPLSDDWIPPAIDASALSNAALAHSPITGTILTDATKRREVFEFIAQACDSYPFYKLKESAANTVDLLLKMSSFSSSTLVGVLGPAQSIAGRYNLFSLANEDNRIIPLFPIVTRSGVSTSPYNPSSPGGSTEFPLPVNASAPFNRGLERFRTNHSSGWINSTDPYYFANDWDPVAINLHPWILSKDRSDTLVRGTGFNFWWLNLCNAFFINDGYTLDGVPASVTHTPDPYCTPGVTSPSRCISDARDLTRDAVGITNWVDDQPIAGTDNQTELDRARTSGANSGGALGEYVRNMILNIAPHVQSDYGLSKLAAWAASSAPPGWVKPSAPTGAQIADYTLSSYDHATRDPRNNVLTDGRQVLSESLDHAREIVLQAQSDYNNSGANAYAAFRRVPDNKLTIAYIGTNAWSESIEAEYGAVPLQTRLQDILGELLCTDKINVVLMFLATTPQEVAQLNLLSPIFDNFVSYYNGVRWNTGLGTAPAPACSGVGDLGKLEVHFINYLGPDFNAYPDTRTKIMAAAREFSLSMPLILERAILDYQLLL